MRDFFANTDAEWAYAPSHDGSMIAWYGSDWTKNVIRVKRTQEAKAFLTLSGAALQLLQLASRQERTHRVGGRSVVADRSVEAAPQGLGGYTPRAFSHWSIISNPYGADGRVVVASDDRNPAFSDLYTVRQDGGGKEPLEKNDGKILDWWLARENVALLRADRLDNDGTRFLIRDSASAPWRTLTEVSARDVFNILFAPQAGKPIYALSNRGRDRIAW